MNTTIFRAQLWELWRLSRLEIAYRTGGVLILALALHGTCTLLMDQPGFNEIYIIAMSFAYLVMFLAACTPFVYSAALVVSDDWRHFLKAQYSRPVSTLQLLGVALAYDVSTRLACHVVLACSFQLLFGLNYPIAGVVLFAAVTGTALFCLAASYIGLWTFLATLAALASVLLVVLFHGAGGNNYILDGPEAWHELFTFFATEYIAMALLTVGVAAFAARAVDRQRHDTARDRGRRISPQTASDVWTGMRQTPFPSAFRAQMWMEIRRVSEVFLAGVVLLLIFFAISFASAVGNSPPIFNGLIWALTFLVCPIVFILGGAGALSGMKARAGTASLSAFEATQAMPLGAGLGLKVAVVFCAHLAGSLVFLSAALLAWHLYPAPALAGLEKLLAGPGALLAGPGALLAAGGAPRVVFAGLVVFSTLSLTLILLSLAGFYGMQRADDASLSTRKDLAIIFAVVVYTFLAVVDVASSWDFTTFWILNAWVAALTLIAFTLRNLQKLFRAHLVARPTFVVVALVWLAFVVAAAWLCVVGEKAGARWNVFENLHLLVFCVGLSFIPLASFAWAPLSLAARRSQ